MFRLRTILPLAAALMLAATAAPRALAFASAQGTPQDNAPPATYTTTQHAADLSPIVVKGQRFSFPVALQLYKKALTRPWSNDPADADKLVCRWNEDLGTHMQTLRCMTNAAHQHEYQATQTGLLLGTNAAGSILCPNPLACLLPFVPVELANFTTQNRIPRSTLAPLLAEMPPADSSYTLRIMDHGKPLIDYVIKNGNLVHVYHYVYESGKPVKQ